MRTQELKLKLVNFAENTVDMIFPKDNVIDKLKNSTCRFFIILNQNKLDAILDMFSDENGLIDIDELIRCYEAALFEDGEFKLDIHKLIPLKYDYMKSFVPNKIVIFKKDEIYSMLRR